MSATTSVSAGDPATAAVEIPLRRSGSPESTTLAAYRGQIVVLDFFAYWCAPCRAVSRTLEEAVQTHYTRSEGNPSGIPVSVVSINVEPGQPDRTAAFIRELGLREVLDDPDSRLFEAFAGEGLPLVVVLDLATAGRPRLIFRTTGLEDIGALRNAIDLVGAAPGEPPPTASRRTNENLPTLRTQSGEGVFEATITDDILLTQSLARFRSSAARTAWDVAAGIGTIGLDYEPSPFDFLGSSARVDETRWSLAGNLRRRLGDDWTLRGGAGYYDGFTDYRSAWLNEYFAQQFNNPLIGTVPGYREADPRGYNLSGGLRYEYLPAAGFVEFNGTFLQDWIAPGYEIDFDGLTRGPERLRGAVYRLDFENVPHQRVRTKLSLLLTDTTGRELRYGAQGAVNVALSERWTLRVEAGGAQEDPEFEAWYAGGSLEYEFSPGWQVIASGRYYEDTGEIENSLSFSTAAPGLRTWQAGLGVRHARGRSVFKLFAAPYFTDYEPVDLGTLFFANLYTDRSWGLIQAVWQLEF